MDEVLAQVSVGFFEIESAALTDGTMMPDTGVPGFSTSFVGIDGNDLSGTFSVLGVSLNIENYCTLRLFCTHELR